MEDDIDETTQKVPKELQNYYTDEMRQQYANQNEDKERYDDGPLVFGPDPTSEELEIYKEGLDE